VEDAMDFRDEVLDELTEERKMLGRLDCPGKGSHHGHLIPLALLVTAVIIMLVRGQTLLIWLTVGLLLYSYNFIILFIPTSTCRFRAGRRTELRLLSKQRRWLAIKLLLKKRWLALEMGLTVFLGGMVPLTLSFSMIFSTGLLLVLYHITFSAFIEWRLAVLLVIQLMAILLFYVVIVALAPQSRGMTQYARSLRRRMGMARTKGRNAVVLMMMVVAGLAAAMAALFLGAFLLPGATLVSLFGSLHLEVVDALSVVFVAACQLVVMHHFQSLLSLSMATRILSTRVESIERDILAPLDAMIAGGRRVDAGAESILREIKGKYYSIAIYDIIRQDLFGHAPVYLIGPRLRYVLDDRVIAHFPG